MARASALQSVGVPSRRTAKRGVEMLARAGYFAKGIVFATVGVLTTMTALGFAGGRITGAEGAIAAISNQPFGRVLLVLLCLGLVGFVVWRFVQAIKDPERHGDDAKGIAKRIGLLVSGLIYAGLALFAARLALGVGGGGGNGAQQGAGWLMSSELGIWLVGIAGAAIVGAALYQLYRAVTASFRWQWDLAEMSATETKWATRISSWGIAARAAALALIGWFFIQAARQADPSEARGLEGALQEFAASEQGPLWLAIVGIGFVCYGIYCFVNGRYKRISP